MKRRRLLGLAASASVLSGCNEAREQDQELETQKTASSNSTSALDLSPPKDRSYEVAHVSWPDPIKDAVNRLEKEIDIHIFEDREILARKKGYTEISKMIGLKLSEIDKDIYEVEISLSVDKSDFDDNLDYNLGPVSARNILRPINVICYNELNDICYGDEDAKSFEHVLGSLSIQLNGWERSYEIEYAIERLETDEYSLQDFVNFDDRREFEEIFQAKMDE
ncbi:MAG: hypothetical protein ABEJ56_01740 [Candidatus Nanohaloarchaea archaeon]